MDSDDIWFKHKLKKVDQFFSLNLNNIAFIQHNLLVLRGSKLTQTRYRKVLLSGNIIEHVKENNIFLPTHFIPTSGLTFPKSILQKVLPIPREFKICADGFLTRTSKCYGDVVSVNESWGAYRIHDHDNTIDNNSFDSSQYIHHILVPALDKFYEKNKINYRLSVLKNIRNLLLMI